METPGVTSSVIPRLTSFLVIFGSSSWSHIATRLPARTSLGRYVSSAWNGKPAISMAFDASLFPFERLVSVMPRISDAITASEQYVS